MNQPNESQRPAGVLRRLALMGPACLVAVAAFNTGGCTHEREVVVRQRAYDEPPPPPPVEETVIEAPPYTPPPPEVVTVYEQDLNPYGHWVQTANYGRCWVPNDRGAGWRPYTRGHWVSSDQGWVWVSEDDDAQFGEVVYHYGRWYEDPSVGWCWVPGSVWGPSWVAWREGGGYCAWAPLPPQCVDGAVVNAAFVNQYVPPDRYYVVEERYISESRVDRRVIVNNVTIINRTKNITNITYVNNRVVNRGVSVKNVEHYSGHPVERVQVTRVTTAEEARRMVASGRPAFYSPPEVDHYVKEHPVRVIHPTRRVADHQPVTPHVDQKTAEQLKVEQEHRGETVNPIDQHAPEHVQKPQVDERAAEDARVKALQEQKAAHDRAEADKAAAERAAHDKALQDKTAAAAQEREKAQRDTEAANQKLAEQRAAQQRALDEKAAREKAAADKAAHEQGGQNTNGQNKNGQNTNGQNKNGQNKNGQKPGDPNNPNNNPNNGPR